jgi:hypothetical protein
VKQLFTFLLFIHYCLISSAQNIGIGTNAPHASAALEIQDTSKGILIPRMTMSKRTAIQSPAEGLMVYQTDSTKGFWFYQSNKWNRISYSDQNKPHYIGEYFGGGIIFHLNYDSNGIQHGLIVSLNNLSNGIVWGCEDSTLNNLSRWDGQTNTLETIRGCGLNNAAGICSNYRGGGFSDWYLPAVEEWKLLYQNFFEVEKSLSLIQGTDLTHDLNLPNEYWTSTRYKTYFYDGINPPTLVTNQAFSFWFAIQGSQVFNTSFIYAGWQVRAIRKF